MKPRLAVAGFPEGEHDRVMEQSEQVVRGYWREVWCEGNPDALSTYYSPDVRENGEPVDLADFGRGVARWFTMFPDFEARVDQIFRDGDWLASRVTYTGTHRDTCFGIPATGRSFEVMGIDLFRVEADLIVDHWHAVDHLDLVLALGGKVAPG